MASGPHAHVVLYYTTPHTTASVADCVAMGTTGAFKIGDLDPEMCKHTTGNIDNTIRVASPDSVIFLRMFPKKGFNVSQLDLSQIS